METPYADEITFAVFLFGMICCWLALLTIRRATALQNSFGVLCRWQMYGDMAQLALITFYCLMSEQTAPGPHEMISIIACQSIEALYFFSGELHVLMAVHRFIFIMAPKRAKAWQSATASLIAFCTATSIVRILGMTAFDRGMYWVYDRPTSLWYITETPWTDFYEMYLELGWSIFEMVAILTLDGITLTQLIIWRSEISSSNQATHRHVEARLVLQSLCQCVPTASITILYFLVFPTIESQFIQFMCSSFVLAFGNVLDAVIILVFHMRKKLFRTNVVQVTATESTPGHVHP